MVQETMYCVKCRKKVKVEGKAVKLKNGRNAVQGKCPKCGTKVFKMVGGKTTKKAAVKKKKKKR